MSATNATRDRPARDGARITRWAMIGVGLAFWTLAIVVPGMQIWITVASAVLVAWAAYGLLVER